MGLLEAMQKHKGQKNLYLYWDIETLNYNKVAGREKPTKYKNVTYSLAIGWYDGKHIDVEVFPSFKSFYESFFDYAKRRDTITKSKTTINMIAHNCNKYDNHFLLHDTQHFFSDDLIIENLYMKSADDNSNTINMNEAKLLSKETNVILEKRVKSSINLDLMMYLKGFKFNIIDNFMKTNTSIATLGKKLKDGGYISEDELKTDFDYDVFDVEHDMTDQQAYAYAYECFHQLTESQMTYIRNDVIILGMCHIHYSDIFPNFDYSAMTFSVNIMKSYINNETTRLQLLNQKGKQKISYTDFTFFDMNFYDFIKGFYRGGLNMYNSRYVDKIINEECFSIDINSSYPYVMYHEKLPMYIYDFDEYEQPTTIHIDLTNKDYFSLYKMDKVTFNRTILRNIESDLIKQCLVKYYNNDKKFVNINTNTLRMIEDLTGLTFDKIKVFAFVCYECEYFGARDIIHHNYFIKTQGKLDKKIIMDSPYNYTITDEVNTHTYSKEEIMLSKVVLNGLYGIPALRSHFNLFRRDEDGFLVNHENGYKNSERNLLFSTFVTSQALYNLLEPLKSLTQSEIDDCFIYCDTDSLYLKSKIKHKLNDELFDPIALGKWDIENHVIKKMYVLNHKKYAYQKEDNTIKIASAGIPLDAFNKNQSFEEFIKNDFHHKAIVYNNKSIYNEQKTISIYPSKTYIEKGTPYDYYFTKELEDRKEDVLKQARREYDDVNDDDILYIESEVGAFSFSDLFPYQFEIKNKCDINILYMVHQDIKNDATS